MIRTPVRPFRSREWFDAPGRPDMTALYLERYMNDAFTREELRSRQADYRHFAIGFGPRSVQPGPS